MTAVGEMKQRSRPYQNPEVMDSEQPVHVPIHVAVRVLWGGIAGCAAMVLLTTVANIIAGGLLTAATIQILGAGGAIAGALVGLRSEPAAPRRPGSDARERPHDGWMS